MGQMMVMLAIGHFVLFILLVGMVYRLAVAVEKIAKCQESLLRDDEKANDARRPFEVRDRVEISSPGR